MSGPFDLDAAVRDGVITPDQARALAGASPDVAPADPSREEPFRLANGFNEVFTALGVTALGVGLVVLGGSWGGLFTGGRAGTSLSWLLPCAGLLWLLAELLTRRLRLLLPSIVLCNFFVGFFAFGAEALVPDTLRSTAHSGPDRLGLFLGSSSARVLAYLAFGAVAAWLFERRFRLSYAYFVLACCLAGALVVLARLSGAGAFVTPVLLAAGLLAFTAAMRFDLSDPARLTRAADSAFWLHLAAAPLVTHALVALLLPGRVSEDGQVWAVLALFGSMSFVALVIDRRAPLVAMLSYLGFAVGTLLGRVGLTSSGVVALALLIVGALVVVLGVGWQPLRARALRLVPRGWAARLPPVA